MERYYIDKIKERKANNLYRELIPSRSLPDGNIMVDGKKYVNFSSNDYLSFSSELNVLSQVKKLFTGTCASRLMTGSTELHHELEKRTAEFKQKDAALIFNSGYQANVGIISALSDKNDVIFSDRLNHASIVDGIKLSGASFFRFRHNDMNHLQKLLIKHRENYKRALIITETVFSMDGDISPLEKICSLKDSYNAILMVDEAHATGVFGSNGAGIVEREGVSEKVDLIMGTYSKALAGFGAYVACSTPLKDYLINFCRSLIYSTSLPEYIMKIDLRAIEKVRNEPSRRIKLIKNTEYFRDILLEKGFDLLGSSQIIPVVFGSSEKTLKVAEALKSKGYWVTAVREPTVPKGKARIRLSLNYAHKKETLDSFAEDLQGSI